MELDKDRVVELLANWRKWAKDDPPDPAEVHYYTVSPMFAGTIPRNSSAFPYDPYEAEIVEEVLREMFKAYRRERSLIIGYYTRDCSAEDYAELIGVSKSTLFRRLDYAQKTFGQIFSLLLWRA